MEHKPNCKINKSCMVKHTNGMCPDKVCTCNISEPTLRDWKETMQNIGKISGIHPEVVDEFTLITKELLASRYAALLEFIDGQDAGKNDLYNEDYIIGFNEAKSLIASHIRNGS